MFMLSGRDSGTSEDMAQKRSLEQEGSKKADQIQAQDADEPSRVQKRPKRAAIGRNYKEKRLCLEKNLAIIEAKRKKTAEDDLPIERTMDAQESSESCLQQHLRGPRAIAQPETSKRNNKTIKVTMTKLINRIWSEYYSSFLSDEAKEDNGNFFLDEQVQEDNEDEEESILAVKNKAKPFPPIRKWRLKCASVPKNEKWEWKGHSVGRTPSGQPLYKTAKVPGGGGRDKFSISVCGAVLAGFKKQNRSSKALPTILFVEYLYEKSDRTKMLHGRVLERGSETVLGYAAKSREVFLTNQCLEVDLKEIKQILEVEIRLPPWGYQYRKANLSEDEADRAQEAKSERKRHPVGYLCKSLYSPEKGAFFALPYENLGLGNGQCHSCRIREDDKQLMEPQMLQNNDGFRFEGMEYYLCDFVYVDPAKFPVLGDEKGPLEIFKASRNRGARVNVFQILEIKSSSGSSKTESKPTKIVARRFFWPQDVGPEKYYTADMMEVYYSDEIVTLEVATIKGKCIVMRHGDFCHVLDSVIIDHILFCSCIYDPKNGTLRQLPANIKLSPAKSTLDLKGKFHVDEIANAKRKGKTASGEQPTEKKYEDSNDCRLSMLDIFAGCGGFLEGLEKSGASFTKWAIGYEEAAAEAFKLNHPEAEVFCQNCNVILRSIMEKGGDINDCISTSEAIDQSSKLTNEQKNKLPLPGQVDFMYGGPANEGFAGMNSFNQRVWSKVHCEMILAFLSYADYYRPKFILLENVTNFVFFKKRQTFRLILASLLEMGYQVRFGVLEAGNYGVSQSHKRTFIWAASPDESLPECPDPMHVFTSSQLKISLLGGLQYAAVKDDALGASFHSTTVRDTIGDLPPVGNEIDKLEITGFPNKRSQIGNAAPLALAMALGKKLKEAVLSKNTTVLSFK